ncbi:NACHT, LRR and PYD domains-containing protein 12-like isoform X4 [Alosa sapidissima]|uniref:NACHT, LRR and PYD domains-containing protein 12-like isoform X4 n=1 Tax=Alosa sapidissima TaxID=34773 RepID=UPI001C086685|nr:NACHT, LRR and PYD domains-containing protein 12-like isoform X4 [Alosa sapidissima]
MSGSQEREEAAGPSTNPRLESAAHSCVQQSSKPTHSDGGVQTHRPPSPVPSCVSMRSDQSKGDMPTFSSEPVPSGLKVQTHRPPSPVPSCVSMRSDQSKGDMPNFSSEPVPSGLKVQTHRPPSPVPSCVSMRSDQSKGDMPTFSSEPVPSGLKIRLAPEEGGAASLTEEQHTSHETWRYQQIHKSDLQKKFQCLIEGITQQGDTRLLHEIYTDLYITEGGRGEVNDEHEVRQIERASWREAARGRTIKCSDIFKHFLEKERRRKEHFLEEERRRKEHFLEGEGKKKGTIFEPRQYKPLRTTVLTKGVAGIGKTVSVQKFILDWAEGTANQDVHFICPLPFRELNLMKEKKLSLVDLIQHFSPEIKDSRVFSSSEYRVMFIFDGLDECRIPPDFHSNPKCCDVTEPASVDVLLTNLIKGNLLPSALLWITTRPAAANQIPPECVNQVTEIRGFNDPQKEEYFKKKISDENLTSRTITHLKSSRSLYIMCHIPVFCWISATVVEKTSKESDKVKMPRTLTQMYTHFLMIQTGIKNVKYTERKETDEEVIFKLGKLAFQQLQRGNLIFYEEDLRECGIDVTEASVYSGVCTQIFREESGLHQGKVFSFVHLSIQEFLAALYVFLCFSNRQRNMPDQQQTSQLSALFRDATLHDLHKTAVDLALQSKNGHLDLFLRFLLGLSLESNQNLLKHLLPQSSSHSNSSEQTVQYVKQKIRDQRSSDRRINLRERDSDRYESEDEDDSDRYGYEDEDDSDRYGYEDEDDSDRRINMFYCLNELNHHAVVEYKMSSEDLHVETLLPGEWGTKLWKTFKMSEEQLAEFDLQKYIKTPEEDQTELLSPDEVLLKVLPAVTSALLAECTLTEKSFESVATVLQSPNSLIELDLSQINLKDSGVQLLSKGLSSPHCKLQTLRLSNCGIADEGHPGESAQKLFSAILENPHHKVEALRFADCKLPEKSCGIVATVLQSPNSLIDLDLSHNDLGDSGVQLLSKGLSRPHCKLQTLRLAECTLTEKSFESVATVLQSPNSLIELDLSQINLKDSGVQLLSKGLSSPHCKLQTLRFADCKLPEKSCGIVATVLQSPNSLIDLDLSHNDLGDSGVQLLSKGLSRPHCKLQTLRLAECKLSERSCGIVATFLQSPNSLKELDLSHNDLQNSGVQLLSKGLSSPHCKLQTLRLADCKLTEKMCETVTSVLQSPNSLLQLDVSDSDLGDSGVQLLSKGLSRPHCKLQTLRLAECKLSERSCGIVATFLQSPNSLKELDLSHNDLQNSGVQLLSKGLSSPHCKLQTLRLADCKLTEKMCETVTSVLQSPNSLLQLDVSDSDLGDSGVHLLSKGLSSSNSILQILRLAGCKLTDTSCEVVASVLQSPNSLQQLDLSDNDLGDSGVQLLSKGLSSSNCKIHTLRLSDCLISEKGCGFLAAALTSTPCYIRQLDLSYNHPRESGLKLLSARLEDPVCKLAILRTDHASLSKARPRLLRYACDLTLDPNTAHRNLSLSEGNRKVTYVMKQQQPYPEHPERFDSTWQVLCREGLTGRCYWEAEWNGDVGADISVAYKSIERKGGSADVTMGGNAKSWSLNCSDYSYSVCHNKKDTDIPAPSSRSRTVGVYLDWPAGTLSFYSVSTNTLTHLHTFHSTFTEPLYPGFGVYYYGSSVSLRKIT